MFDNAEVIKQLMSAAIGVLATVFAMWRWSGDRSDKREARVREEIQRANDMREQSYNLAVSILQAQIKDLNATVDQLESQSCAIVGCRERVCKVPS